MDRILKKYTTVPQSLYVSRAADEQLKNIILEMERPGYVLVARQMGKTNLLANAKRTLESEDRIFIYVDLSNPFSQERDCYRYIIDCFIEPNFDIFEPIEFEIDKIRKEEYPPHQEYTRSLRKIINFFKGNVVIILDEIDALRSADYSDNIFAQIRSNYFSRTNFPEFGKLTYILSGVIEPIELIKDRNKSPFNIGEKIYLDDFNKEELCEFIKKSQLNLEKIIVDNIYKWTAGNPRLTFDICSDIESFLTKKPTICENDVDDIVLNKYLTSFDIAPIDHIRELVTSNKEVRNAVFNIQQGDADNITDTIKKKLYLYGIINPDFNKLTKIKNPIIEKSLSIDWIKEIDQSIGRGLNYAIELFSDGKYRKSIDTFLEFLDKSEPNVFEKETANYHIGYSYYHLDEIPAAIGYFDRNYTQGHYIRSSSCFLGMCKIRIGDKLSGIEILEEVIKEETNDFAYQNSLLNLALHINDQNRSLLLYDKLYNSTLTDDIESKNDKSLNRLRCMALYFKGHILMEKNNHFESSISFKEALKFATNSSKPSIFYAQFLLTKDINYRTTISNHIIENKLNTGIGNNYSIDFTESSLFKYLNFVFDEENPENFEKLLSYAKDEIYSGESKKSTLAYLAYHASKPEQNIKILHYIIKNHDDIELDFSLQISRDLLLSEIKNTHVFLEHLVDYEKKILEKNSITSNDIFLFSVAIRKHFDEKELNEAIRLCKFIEKKSNTLIDDTSKRHLAMIYYWLVRINGYMGNEKETSFYSKKALSIINNCDGENDSLLDKESLTLMKEQILEILSKSIRPKPTLIGRKYGRNERIIVKYDNGSIAEGKYKKLKSDIDDNKCVIIPPPL